MKSTLYYREWIALVVFLFLVSALILIAYGKEKGSEIEVLAYEAQSSQLIEIRLAGALIHPGVYLCRPGTTMKGILDQAGGLAKEADRKHIQIKKILLSSQEVYIPFKAISSKSKKKPPSKKRRASEVKGVDPLKSATGVLDVD